MPVTPAFRTGGLQQKGPTAEGKAYQSLTTDGAGATAYRTTLPPWYVEDLIFSNNGTDADHDLDNTAGWVVSNDAAFADRVLFQVPAIVKQFDATFAAGTAAGGMKNGTTIANNTWYRVWAVWGAGVTADLVADAGNTAPALSGDLAAYTKIAPVFDFLTDGSANILGFKHVCDWVIWDTPITNLSTTTPATSATLLRTSTPARNVIWNGELLIADSTGALSVGSIGHGDTTNGNNAWNVRVPALSVNAAASGDAVTNSSGQVYYWASAAGWTTFVINSHSFQYCQGRE